MRDRRDRLTMTAVGALALLAAGCAHNDVLVFGTSTTIGLNVETASSQGAAPSIVLGYEREEAVWMPLLVNGKESVLPLCPVGTNDECGEGPYPLDQAMYRSTIRDHTGQRVVQTDAYSVFASLGAHFNGRGNATEGAAAGGGLAQFFATGNAAINVSQNPSLVTALKIESSDGADAQALAVAASSDNVTAQSIRSALTAAELAASEGQGLALRNVHLRNVDVAMVCIANPDGTLRWSDVVGALAGYSDRQKAGLKQSTTRDQIRQRLAASDVLTRDVLTAAKAAPFNCPTD